MNVKKMFEALLRNQGWSRRSTALTTVSPLLAVVFVGGTLFIRYAASGPLWLTVIFTVAICLVILVFLSAFVYCLLKEPDLLRSERYGLEKMAIERGVLGDDIQGRIEDTSGIKSLQKLDEEE